MADKENKLNERLVIMKVTSTMKRQLIRLIIKRDDYTKEDVNNQRYVNAIEAETSRFFNDMNGNNRDICEQLVIEELKKID